MPGNREDLTMNEPDEDLVQQLLDNRSLTLRDRTTLLAHSVPPELESLIEERRLNWLERPLVMLLAVAGAEPLSTVDLATALKRRTGEVEEQLEWLRRKQLIEDDEDGDDGTVYWQLAGWVGELAKGPVTQ